LNNRIISFLLFQTIVVTVLADHKPTERDLHLDWQGPTYSVTYSFTTDCSPENLLQLFLQPEHVVACMKRANLHINVVDSAPFHNRIIYSYSYLISKLHLHFNRKADTTTQKVHFTMEACSTSGSSLVPSVRMSRGYYAIIPGGDSCRVDYWQETTLDRRLNDFYLFFIKRDTRRVLRNQERYVSRWKEKNMHTLQSD